MMTSKTDMDKLIHFVKCENTDFTVGWVFHAAEIWSWNLKMMPDIERELASHPAFECHATPGRPHFSLKEEYR